MVMFSSNLQCCVFFLLSEVCLDPPLLFSFYFRFSLQHFRVQLELIGRGFRARGLREVPSEASFGDYQETVTPGVKFAPRHKRRPSFCHLEKPLFHEMLKTIVKDTENERIHKPVGSGNGKLACMRSTCEHV